MADHSARPHGPASSPSLAALHAKCREDFTSSADRRAQDHRDDTHLTADDTPALPWPSDLTTAIAVGQQMLAVYGTVPNGDLVAYAQAHGGLTEALRILLRALGAEAVNAR